VPKKKKRLKKVRNRIYDRQFIEKEQAQLRERERERKRLRDVEESEEGFKDGKKVTMHVWVSNGTI
jgi:hypothetical protein